MPNLIYCVTGMAHPLSLVATVAQPYYATAAKRPVHRPNNKTYNKPKKEAKWQCVKGCGACCKLDKGPSFPSPQDVFEDPSDVELYRSLIGPDGWCIHYQKSTRTCSIYAERPYFCRVEPDVFQALYGINKKEFNKEACSCCIDAIKSIYGSHSEELDNFNQAIWRTSSKPLCRTTAFLTKTTLGLVQESLRKLFRTDSCPTTAAGRI